MCSWNCRLDSLPTIFLSRLERRFQRGLWFIHQVTLFTVPCGSVVRTHLIAVCPHWGPSTADASVKRPGRPQATVSLCNLSSHQNSVITSDRSERPLTLQVAFQEQIRGTRDGHSAWLTPRTPTDTGIRMSLLLGILTLPDPECHEGVVWHCTIVEILRTTLYCDRLWCWHLSTFGWKQTGRTICRPNNRCS